MKKLLTIVLILLLVVSVVGCNSIEKENDKITKNEKETTNKVKEESTNNENEKSEPIYIGQTWVTGSLNPVEGSSSWALTSHGLTEYVYMLDRDGMLKSRFIYELKQLDDLTWEATMNEGVKFSDGTVVDSKALCDCMNNIMQNNPLSNATAGKIVFNPTGEYSFKLKTERPNKAMESVFAEWSNVVFKDLGNNEYIFTGPYMVSKFISGTELEMEANPYYPNAENRTNLVIKALKDVSAMKLAMESGEIDMAFTVTAQVAEMLKKENITIKSIDAGYQYFAPINLDGVLSDKIIREAINIGIDRNEYLSILKGGTLPTGLFAHYYIFNGNNKLIYNKDKAMELLDKDGWKLDNGLRYKNGEALKIKLITYASRPDLSIIMQVMTSQLSELGIECETSIVESIDSELKKGDFDIALYAQHTAPTGNPAYFLNQFFRTDGPKNHMKYSSSKVDTILDEMGNLPLNDEMYQKSIDIQNIIFEDLPVLYILDPKWHIAVSKKLNNYTPYCGDYYIVNDELYTK